MKKQDRIKETVKLLNENEDKYCSLVWYARANQEKLLETENYEALAQINAVEKKYPSETKDLITDHENWQHGFNSGALAYTRLYLEMIEGNIEFALDNHPFLDT